MLPRRQRTNPTIDAFHRVAEAIDEAQRSLLAAIPTARRPGVPLADAIAGFEASLRRAEALMPGWRRAETEALHDACAAAIEEAAALAGRLRLHPVPLDFEALNARVGDVLHPLERFADVERYLRPGRRIITNPDK